MRKIYKILVVTILVAVGSGILFTLNFDLFKLNNVKDISSTDQQKSDDLILEQMKYANAIDPRQILTEVKRRYDSFSKYECDGFIQESNPYKKTPIRETNFTLQYENPSKIQINWMTDSTKKTFIGSKKSTVLSIDNKIKEKFDDPFWGLVALSSREDTNLFEIGKILIGKEDNPDDYFFKEVTVEPNVLIEEINGSLCYKISIGLPLNYEGQITYWIETDSLLIKKIQRDITFGENKEVAFSNTESYTKIVAK